MIKQEHSAIIIHLFPSLSSITTHHYLKVWCMKKKKVLRVFRFKRSTGFLITNELWQVCWVATCPILSMMPADSSALICERWNMWKKLVFYISQLVTSSPPQTLTSHLDSNTPAEKRGRGEHRGPGWDLCFVYGKRKKEGEREKRREGGSITGAVWGRGYR